MVHPYYFIESAFFALAGLVGFVLSLLLIRAEAFHESYGGTPRAKKVVSVSHESSHKKLQGHTSHPQHITSKPTTHNLGWHAHRTAIVMSLCVILLGIDVQGALGVYPWLAIGLIKDLFNLTSLHLYYMWMSFNIKSVTIHRNPAKTELWISTIPTVSLFAVWAIDIIPAAMFDYGWIRAIYIVYRNILTTIGFILLWYVTRLLIRQRNETKKTRNDTAERNDVVRGYIIRLILISLAFVFIITINWITAAKLLKGSSWKVEQSPPNPNVPSPYTSGIGVLASLFIAIFAGWIPLQLPCTGTP